MNMKKKASTNINYLKRCKLIIDIVNAHYRAGFTTYAGIFRTFILPVYPMCYASFMRIINMPNVDKQLKEALEKAGHDTETTE